MAYQNIFFSSLLIVKALLIFEPQTFENYPDAKVLKHSRIFALVYATLRFILAATRPPVSSALTNAVAASDVQL